jgi:hypothetical protein
MHPNSSAESHQRGFKCYLQPLQHSKHNSFNSVMSFGLPLMVVVINSTTTAAAQRLCKEIHETQRYVAVALTSVVSSGSSMMVRMTCQQGVMPVPPAIRLMLLQQQQQQQQPSSQSLRATHITGGTALAPATRLRAMTLVPHRTKGCK